ncbi:MAG TPA: hypothetical protein VNX40_05250, partial [Mucilaginibacter sp.]|nr:hypothetical protein [Mucilaginibacter sp.]
HYNENSLQFQPFVPKALAGERSLENYKYRNVILNISMRGFGNLIKSISLDGKILQDATIPASLTGVHTVKITLADNVLSGKSNLQPGYTAPETPIVNYSKGTLNWDKIPGAISYRILKNGKILASVKTHNYKVPANEYAEYQVASVDAKGISSFNSEPVQVIPANVVSVTEAETVADKSDLPYQGFSGSGFVEISKTKNSTINIPVNITQTGVYAIDFKYANGNGPINTENKCAIRTLDADGHFAGTMVFPQRGKGVWSEWGFSNSVKLHLSKGKHIISLQFKPANENMNGDVNQAMVDYLRVIRLD